MTDLYDVMRWMADNPDHPAMLVEEGRYCPGCGALDGRAHYPRCPRGADPPAPPADDSAHEGEP